MAASEDVHDEAKEKAMTPTIGRIVHYYNGWSRTPRAAMINRVYDHAGVDLTVFLQDTDSECDPPTSIQIVTNVALGTAPPDSPAYYTPFWVWPPRM